MNGGVLRQGLNFTDFIVFVNDFRFYANCTRNPLMLIVVKLIEDILLLFQAFDNQLYDYFHEKMFSHL